MWCKEDRRGVFVDHNHNPKDPTVASAYSVRPTDDATVSAPLAWDEVDRCVPGDFTLSSIPKRFARDGDPHSRIDEHSGSLEPLLALYDAQGLGDAPWPPHYEKQKGEPPRVQPSKRASAGKSAKRAGAVNGKGTRAAKKKRVRRPLIEIGRAKRAEDALAGLRRWKRRHREAAAHLEEADVLVDSMRGRYSTWTRIRVSLEHVPPKLRPPQEALDPDEKTLASS
jgi:hypothetical protein